MNSSFSCSSNAHRANTERTRHGSCSASRSALFRTTNSVAVMPDMVVDQTPLSHLVIAAACARGSTSLSALEHLIISSRTAACVLVLMQVLGALFECQGCVPPHIRNERSNLA